MSDKTAAPNVPIRIYDTHPNVRFRLHEEVLPTNPADVAIKGIVVGHAAEDRIYVRWGHGLITQEDCEDIMPTRQHALSSAKMEEYEEGASKTNQESEGDRYASVSGLVKRHPDWKTVERNLKFLGRKNRQQVTRSRSASAVFTATKDMLTAIGEDVGGVDTEKLWKSLVSRISTRSSTPENLENSLWQEFKTLSTNVSLLTRFSKFTKYVSPEDIQDLYKMVSQANSLLAQSVAGVEKTLRQRTQQQKAASIDSVKKLSNKMLAKGHKEASGSVLSMVSTLTGRRASKYSEINKTVRVANQLLRWLEKKAEYADDVTTLQTWLKKKLQVLGG